MANKHLFASTAGRTPKATAKNEAGGAAYALAPKHALAQLAATGTFQTNFYAAAETQLDTLLALVDQVDDNVFLAKLAVYAREKAYMKDMPAALLCAVAKRDAKLMQRIFRRVVDNGRVLRTAFQMIRSGVFGRKGLSASLQRAFQAWFKDAKPAQLLSASIGNDPSLRDILRLARPTPLDNAQRAMFGWLTNKPEEKWAPATAADLPAEVTKLLAYQTAPTEAEQLAALDGLHVRWDLLSDAARGPNVWKAIAKAMGPQALRMNLNTLARHEVFLFPSMVEEVARRIADPDEVRRSRQFPYQYLAAYMNAGDEVPQAIKAALHQAAELARGNVPAMPGPVVIGLDVSGSMASPVTGQRGRGATSKMRCVDVAALFAAAILRRNPESVIIPFDTRAFQAKFDPQDTILSLAERLAKFGGGGTDCSLPLADANTRLSQRKFVGAVIVSDCESWQYGGRVGGVGRGGSTGLVNEWSKFVANQRQLGVTNPKLCCIDLQAYATTQAPESHDVMNIGGFSDAVFGVVSAFLADDASRFVTEVEAIEL